MTILPVLDLLDGVVVRGVAGEREKYRPIESCLTASAEILEVAKGFREFLGVDEFYVADLDAILHSRANLAAYRSLVAEGFKIVVDAGVRDVSQAYDVLEAGVEAIIAGLETCPGPELLQDICREFGASHVIFSLDMQSGQLLGHLSSWKTDDPFSVAGQVVDAGIQRIIVLDLSRVGLGQGVGTGPLCLRLREHYPHLQIITGGGVRGVEDLKRLQEFGVDAVLVASALHDGSIGRREIASL